jgi:RNA polymerase sigma factor (sigma-70 family)
MYNESEVLMLAKEQNEDALQILYAKYERIIDIILTSKEELLNSLKIDYQDAYIECLEALNDAIYNYNEETTKASFETFASLVIKRKLQNMLRLSFSQKNKINLNSIDLSCITIDEEKLKYLLDFKNEPLTNMINESKANLASTLSTLEKEVLSLLLAGYSELEIAQSMQKSSKQIYNTIQRIRQKIKSRLVYN